MSLTSTHRQLLTESAITDEVIDASGIESYDHPKHGTGIRFPWSDGVADVLWQTRPDKPFVNDDGDPVKYMFPKGAQIPLNRLRETGADKPAILVEGTKQSYAVKSHAPSHMAVYGMAGCWGFRKADLTPFYGREVYVLMDADFTTNPDVYAAAEHLKKQLSRHGAAKVLFTVTTGTGKDGVDDVLAGFAPDKRAEMLRIWLSQSTDKLGRRPAAKTPQAAGTEGPERYFRQQPKPLRLTPATYARDLLKDIPAARTPDHQIALYRNGVYEVDESTFLSRVVSDFDDYFTPSILTTTKMTVLAMLGGKMLPERATEPLLNCRNGMVDLRTGELSGHDPKYMSSLQVAVDYDRAATAPAYEAWLRDALRQKGATEADVDALVDDIEEVAGTMLDPSRAPSKTLFLFGPSRSGKSTFLRILKAIAGAVNTSAVTLHDMVDDHFAKANLYGKMLNVAADLSNKHVGDLSAFKMIVGDDPIHGNRKYGKEFTFSNQSLIAFSANELPTVSEASRAYVERMKPFEFPNSFAGREDKHLEGRLLAELPGILARWVAAYGRFLARGGYRATDAATEAQFEAKSDRVVQFFQDMCTVTPAKYGQRMTGDQCMKRRDVAVRFNEWAERNGGSKMGERAFFQRLASIKGVTEVRDRAGARCYNMSVASAADDNWADEAEPVADPVEPSGADFDVPRLGAAGAADPWTASETVPEAVTAVVDAAGVVDVVPVVTVPDAAQSVSLAASAAPAEADAAGVDYQGDPWAEAAGIELDFKW